MRCGGPAPAPHVRVSEEREQEHRAAQLGPVGERVRVEERHPRDRPARATGDEQAAELVRALLPRREAAPGARAADRSPAGSRARGGRARAGGCLPSLDGSLRVHGAWIGLAAAPLESPVSTKAAPEGVSRDWIRPVRAPRTGTGLAPGVCEETEHVARSVSTQGRFGSTGRSLRSGSWSRTWCAPRRTWWSSARSSCGSTRRRRFGARRSARRWCWSARCSLASSPRPPGSRSWAVVVWLTGERLGAPQVMAAIGALHLALAVAAVLAFRARSARAEARKAGRPWGSRSSVERIRATEELERSRAELASSLRDLEGRVREVFRRVGR